MASYGEGDASFRAAGGKEGIFTLVNTFYDLMRDTPRYQEIWDLHPGD